MLQSVNLPLCEDVLAPYGGPSGLRRELRELGLDGVEGIWGGVEIPADFPKDLLTGYHLTFFPDWLDFYREDHAALRRKFGTLDAAWQFYGGKGPETLLKLYREDLARARSLGARYVVFHVSDVSIEETYTYRWLHTDEEVLDASAEIINALLKGIAPDFDFLVENQWWAGFTFTEPEKTARHPAGHRTSHECQSPHPHPGGGDRLHPDHAGLPRGHEPPDSRRSPAPERQRTVCAAPYGRSAAGPAGGLCAAVHGELRPHSAN